MASMSPDAPRSFERNQFPAVGEKVKKIYIDWLTDALTTCACYQHPYGQLIPSGYTGEGTVILDKLGEKLTEKGAQVDFVDFRDEKQVVAECAKLIKQLQADFPRVSPDELSAFTAEPMDEKTLSNPVIAVKGFTTLLAISNTAGPNRQQAQKLIKQIQDLYTKEDTRRKPVLIVDSDENDVKKSGFSVYKTFPHQLPFGKLEAVAPAATTLAEKIFIIIKPVSKLTLSQ